MSQSRFSEVMLSGASWSFGSISFLCLTNCSPAISFSVSKKYGNSVQRNLFKRRCKSIFKSMFIDSDRHVSIIVRPKSKNVSFHSALQSFSLLYEKTSG